MSSDIVNARENEKGQYVERNTTVRTELITTQSHIYTVAKTVSNSISNKTINIALPDVNVSLITVKHSPSNENSSLTKATTSINKSDTLVSNQAQKYSYTWRDGIDYEKLCKNILNRLKHDSDSSLIHDGKNGGLGHKTLSISLSLLYGIILNTNYHLFLCDEIWRSLDTCLEEVKYDEAASKKYPRGATVWKTKSNFNITDGVIDLSPLTAVKNAVIVDLRLDRNSLLAGKNGELLKSIGIFEKGESFFGAQKLLYRLLLNPSEDLKRLALKRMQTTWTKKITIGIQIRCGGQLANKKERVSFLTREKLDLIPDYIDAMVKRLNVNLKDVNLFISTDSTLAFNIINNSLNNCSNIVDAGAFTIGHTTSRAQESPTKRALLDAYMLSFADALLVTRRSSFGALVTLLSETTNIMNIG